MFYFKTSNQVEPWSKFRIFLHSDNNTALFQEYHYKAGNEFEEFIERFKSKKPLKLHYYLKKKEIEENNGDNKLSVIDANGYKGGKYQENEIFVNNQMEKQILLNILWVRTVDTGSWDGRGFWSWDYEIIVGIRGITRHIKNDGYWVSADFEFHWEAIFCVSRAIQ